MSKSDRDLPVEGELNPNHPMTRFVRDQWPKIAALLMQELGCDEFEITTDRIDRLVHSGKAIIVDGRNERMVIRLMSEEEGKRLARSEGGLPV